MQDHGMTEQSEICSFTVARFRNGIEPTIRVTIRASSRCDSLESTQGFLSQYLEQLLVLFRALQISSLTQANT